MRLMTAATITFLWVVDLLAQNPYYRNQYQTYSYYDQQQSIQDYNRQVYEDTMRHLEKANMNMRLNQMQHQLDLLYQEKNEKKHEEDFGLFLNGQRFPKAKVVEPGIFQSDSWIYVKIPSTGDVVPYGLDSLHKKYVKNGVVIGTVDLFTFEINLEEVDAAMKKQGIGPYSDKKEKKETQNKTLLRK